MKRSSEIIMLVVFCFALTLDTDRTNLLWVLFTAIAAVGAAMFYAHQHKNSNNE